LLSVQMRHYAMAVADFKQASTLDARRPPWEEVIRAYSQLLERYPLEAEAYHQRAHAYERLDQWEKAIDDHSQDVQRAPQRLDLLVCRGKALLRTGQNDRATEDFRAVGQKPDWANHVARGLVTSPNLMHRAPALAVELAMQAVRQAPGEAPYWNTLGIA